MKKIERKIERMRESERERKIERMRESERERKIGRMRERERERKIGRMRERERGTRNDAEHHLVEPIAIKCVQHIHTCILLWQKYVPENWCAKLDLPKEFAQGSANRDLLDPQFARWTEWTFKT